MINYWELNLYYQISNDRHQILNADYWMWKFLYWICNETLSIKNFIFNVLIHFFLMILNIEYFIGWVHSLKIMNLLFCISEVLVSRNSVISIANLCAKFVVENSRFAILSAWMDYRYNQLDQNNSIDCHDLTLSGARFQVPR